jgi:hypothetical protein
MAVILRSVFHTDDTHMDRGEVVEIGVDAVCLLEFVCCYPDVEMM